MRDLLMAGRQLTRSLRPRPNRMKRCAVGCSLYAYLVAMTVASARVMLRTAARLALAWR